MRSENGKQRYVVTDKLLLSKLIDLLITLLFQVTARFLEHDNIIKLIKYIVFSTLL